MAKLLFAIPNAVKISTLLDVGPNFQLISISVMRMGTAVCDLMKMVPYSASDDDAMMLRMILKTTIVITLEVGMKSSGFCVLGGPSLKNGHHWPGFEPERTKGMKRQNG